MLRMAARGGTRLETAMTTTSTSTLRKVWATLGAVLLVVLLGWVDGSTGPDLSLSLFYLFPIALGTWWGGPWIGFGVAFLSGAAWRWADHITNPNMREAIAYWNAGIRLGIFIVVSRLLTDLRLMKERLEERVAQKTAALTAEIEERKRAQQVIRESEQWYRSVIENAGPAIICLTPDLRILEWNIAAGRLFGRSRESVLGQRYDQVVAQTEAPALLAEDFARVLDGQPPPRTRHVVRTADGRRRLLSVQATRVLNTTGAPQGIILWAVS